MGKGRGYSFNNLVTRGSLVCQSLPSTSAVLPTTCFYMYAHEPAFKHTNKVCCRRWVRPKSNCRKRAQRLCTEQSSTVYPITCLARRCKTRQLGSRGFHQGKIDCYSVLVRQRHNRPTAWSGHLGDRAMVLDLLSVETLYLSYLETFNAYYTPNDVQVKRQ